MTQKYLSEKISLQTHKLSATTQAADASFHFSVFWSRFFRS